MEKVIGKRTIGEIIDQLVEADLTQYSEIRLSVSDSLIDMIRDMMPEKWQKIREKEIEFKRILEIISQITTGLDSTDKSGHYGC